MDSRMGKVEDILSIIEVSVKRLVVPTAMLIAVYLIGSKSLESLGSMIPVGTQIFILVASAIIYLFASGVTAIYKILKLGLPKWYFMAVGTGFFCSYSIMAYVSVLIGVSKIS